MAKSQLILAPLGYTAAFEYVNNANMCSSDFVNFVSLVIALAAHISELEYDNGTEETSSKAVSEVEITCYIMIIQHYPMLQLELQKLPSYTRSKRMQERRVVTCCDLQLSESSSIPSRLL